MQSIYSDLITTAIHTAKPENIISFLGKKFDAKYPGEAGNNYNIRIQGSRIKQIAPLKKKMTGITMTEM